MSRNPTLKKATHSRYTAWAAIGVKSGRVLTDLTGHFSIYEQKQDAVKDCPKYGYVDQVTISVRRHP